MQGKPGMPCKIAMVGIGKIARDQHLPAIVASPDFTLVATASPVGAVDGVPRFLTLEAMLAAMPDIEAVALCTPPQCRGELARFALRHGKHVLLEKPPAACIGEVGLLRGLAERCQRCLMAGWHSRFAPAVPPARAWLADRRVQAVTVDWKEDVRAWHPDQSWIWQPGGMGVFDAGINALSILTQLLPNPFYLQDGVLSFPANRATPIAAKLDFADEEGTAITASFDWRSAGLPIWDIRIRTDNGAVCLSQGGHRWTVDGIAQPCADPAEYVQLYRHFAGLIARRQSDVDDTPLRHVADAFLLARRSTVTAFD